MKRPIDRWTTPEAALLAYRSTGDPDAVRVLFDRTAPTLFRVALASAPDAPSAEDLLQETYVAFLGRLDAFEAGQPVMPWLLGILRNRAKRAGRAAGRRPDPRRLSPRERSDPLRGEEEASVVRAAIEALDEPYRSVGLLHFVYGLEPAEIAHVHGQPPGTVRSQLHRARERLRTTLRASPALLLLGDPVRSLASVREAVVAHAVSSVAAGAVLVGGALMTKKVTALAALAALLLIGGAVIAWRPNDGAGVDEAGSGPLLEADVVEGPVLRGMGPVPVERIDATPPDGPHVVGRVVDAEGLPIAGAFLAAIPSTCTVGQDPHGASISSGISDPSGRVFVPLGDDAPTFFLYGEARGCAPAMAHEVRDGEEVEVTLGRATALAGVVRNRDGEAVPGAQLTFFAMIGGATRTWLSRADATGAYCIEGLPIAVPTTPTGTLLACWIRVVADGYAQSTTMHEVTAGAGETQTKDLFVLRGVSIRGQVVLADTKAPVAGAHVALAPSGRSRGRMLVFGHEVGLPSGTAPLARTRADGDGRFTFEHAPCAQRGWAPGSNPIVFAWSANTCLGSAPMGGAEDEENIEISVEVHPAAIVTGRLVDAAGAALRNVRVWVRTTGLDAASGLPPEDEAPRASDRTDATGMFRLAGVPARLGAKMPAVLTSGAQVHFGAPYRKVVERNIEVEGRVTLDLGTLVCEEPSLPEDQDARTSRIRVVDGAGEPVWGAAVGHSYTNLILRTDREGRTAITWGGSGTGPVSMLVRASGFATRLVDVPIGEAEQIVKITRETATIRGTVVGPSDEPIRGATVEVAPESVPEAEAFPADKHFWQMPRFVVGVGVTDHDGRFTVGDLSPGRYRIRARMAVEGATVGGPPGTEKHAVLLSGLETSQDGIVVRLPTAPTSGGVRVDVRIVDSQSGRAVLGAAASLRMTGRTLHAAEDGPGRHFFAGVPAGVGSLTVSAAGYLPSQRSITVGVSVPDAIDVALVFGSGLKGRAELPVPQAERPMYLIWLLATTGELRREPAYRVRVEPDGTFTTQGLEAGRYYVVARRLSPQAGTPRYLVPRSAFVDLPAHATVERTFAFEAGGLLKVQPADDRLPPRPWGSQSATAEQTRFGEQSWILLRDEAGNDMVRHEGVARDYAGVLGDLALRPGRYTLHVQLGGDAPREIPVTIEAGAEKTISL